MAHGNSQRLGGELGYTSAALPVAAVDDVDDVTAAVAALDAEDIAVDTAEFDTPLDPEVTTLAAVLASLDARLVAVE